MVKVDSDAIYSFLQGRLMPCVEVTEDAYFSKTKSDDKSLSFSGAGYRRDGSIILRTCRPAALGHWRHDDPITIDRRFVENDIKNYKEVIFGGHFFPLWGHFILETLSTAYSSNKFSPEVPLVFFDWPPMRDYDAGWLWDRVLPILRAAGWGERAIIRETGPFTVSKLHTPERLAVYCSPLTDNVFAPEMRVVFDQIRESIAPNSQVSRKIVIKRPASNERCLPCEEEIYSSLNEIGFDIITGADLSTQDQVRVFAEASIVVGFQGSALHNSAFCRAGTQVFEMADRNSYVASASGNLNSVQVGICRLLDQELKFIHTLDEAGNALPPSKVISNILEDIG